MKKKILFLVMLFVFFPNCVKANWADCYAALSDNSSVSVGDTFVLDVGSAGLTYNSDVYGLHFVIQYEKDVFEPVTGGVVSYFDWENVSSTIRVRNGIIYDYLLVDMSTSDNSKYIIGSSGEYDRHFVKLAGIKFKVKSTAEKNSVISLIPVDVSTGNYYPTDELSSYKMVYWDNEGEIDTEPRMEVCTDKTNVLVSIYKKAYLTGISINGEKIKEFDKNKFEYNLSVDKPDIDITATAEVGYSVSGHTGEKKLNDGVNTFIIKVSSPTGDEKQYTLNITYTAPKSSVNTLKTLSISPLKIDFDSDKTVYQLEADNDIDKIKIESTLTDSKATYVSGFGNREVLLKEGVNEVLIKVKAENGSEKVYILSITRKNKTSTSLVQDISIDNYILNFSPSEINYNLFLEQDVTTLPINVKLTDSSSKYDIKGNENLQNGSVITISVTSKDDYNVNYYIHIVKKVESRVAKQRKTGKILLIILIPTIVIASAILAFVLLRRKKRLSR